METEVYFDLTGDFSCPACKYSSQHTYTEVPPHHREWMVREEGERVSYLPAMRDYTCGSCDFEWTMDVDQEE